MFNDQLKMEWPVGRILGAIAHSLRWGANGMMRGNTGMARLARNRGSGSTNPSNRLKKKKGDKYVT